MLQTHLHTAEGDSMPVPQADHNTVQHQLEAQAPMRPAHRTLNTVNAALKVVQILQPWRTYSPDVAA